MPNDQLPARESFTHVIIGLPLQLERESACSKSAKALTSGAGESERDCVVGQAFVAVATRDLARQRRSYGAIRIGYRERRLHVLAFVERRPCDFQQNPVQTPFPDGMTFPRDVMAHDPTRALDPYRSGQMQQRRQIERAGLGATSVRSNAQQTATPDTLVHGTEAELRHDLPHFLGDEEEVIHDVLGLSGESGA